ncbi:DUF2764 family protein [Thalassoroseus pseudoceratinae]|uniref:DUF2764 family protein n=1 Tax=Thalassoroseus pseudoceratinae TaxID=2713176 RepID=UPI0014246914|nr:DUF2764 family protein [Thalassoroseus pseudoceratinae]
MSYFTLIASLPPLPPHFDVTRPPITRLQLDERLKMLTEEDTETIAQLNEFLAWDHQPLEQSDTEVINRFHKLKHEVHHPIIWRIVENRLNMRTIISALRRRRAGDGPPQGVGELVDPIRRNFKEPYFRLENRFPWIETFARHWEAGEALEAERILFEVMWKLRHHMATRFTFSFEAVLLYLARWTIVDRWTSRDAEVGKTRFDQMIEETLGDYANITF